MTIYQMLMSSKPIVQVSFPYNSTFHIHEVCKLSDVTNSVKVLLIKLYIDSTACKIVSLGNHTAFQMDFPLFIAVQELRNWNLLQLVDYNFSNLVYHPKMLSSEIFSQSHDEKVVTGTQIG